MFKTLKGNEDGLIFVYVTMIVIVLMVLTISIVGTNVSQVGVSDDEIRQIQADILAQGYLALTYINQTTPSAGNLLTNLVPLDGHIFNIISNVDSATNLITVNVSY
tara:strand:- start:188 stop:505 length:318 start_codon:yes stop_codon:yes gene_type:complete